MDGLSLAEHKRLWRGKKNLFAKKDLNKWLKLYDETKLHELKQKISKNVNFGEALDDEEQAFNLNNLRDKLN